jgi:ornithine cyclodeaminase
MQIVQKQQIVEALDFPHALTSIENAFIAFSNGDVVVPPPGYLRFSQPPGDMHIKYGHQQGDDIFVIKVATGFYDNPKLGQPSSNGLMLILSAQTGQPLCLLEDQGYLTDKRTGIAGALITHTLATQQGRRVGVVGTGVQAREQLIALKQLEPNIAISAWGRNTEALSRYVQDMQSMGIVVAPYKELSTLCRQSNVLVTTTASQSALIRSEWVQAGTHITALGADAPDKQELDPDLFKRASRVFVDSRSQCIDHGETRQAIQQHIVNQNDLIEFGELLQNKQRYQRQTQDITIADLTGIAAQDIAIAKSVYLSLLDCQKQD